MKTPKFMICENPIGKEPDRIFILHVRSPFILAEAFHFDLDEEQEWMKCKSAFTVGASVDYPNELIALGAIWHEAVEGLPQEQVDKLAAIMSRMGDWYFSYLKYEDSL